MAIVLNTPIILSNIHRWKALDYAPHKYSSPKYAEIVIQVICADGTEYNQYTLIAKDVANCTILTKKASPDGILDRLETALASKPGAYSAIVAADEAATGGDYAHLEAIALACISTGLVAAELAGT